MILAGDAMTRLQLRWTVLTAVGLVWTQACGSSSPIDPSGLGSAAALRFTHLPVANAGSGTFGVTPLGYRNIGSNSTIRPYLDFFSGGQGVGDVSVFAPAGGTVSAVVQDQANGKNRLDVTSAGGYRYYLTGDDLSFSVAPGTAITAGQVVGRRSGEFRQGASSVGLGLIHPANRLGFISPDRYPDELLYAASPLDYYAEPTRTLIAGALQPSAATGELNFDIPGRLQGFWYLPTIPRSESTSVTQSSGWLWFLKTMTAQNLGMSGASVYAPSPEGKGTTYFLEADSGPSAATVSPASGVVTYRFPYSATNAVVVRVQMLTDTSVRAETFDTYYGLPEGFTGNAKLFVR